MSNGVALLAAIVCSWAIVTTGHAAPYRPASDDLVLEHLPPALLAIRQLRGAAAPSAGPQNLDAVLASAQHYVELGQTYADPRAYGYAQAALGEWWTRDDGATSALLVMRARILQFNHRWAPALGQLKVSLAADPFQPDAWLLVASIEQVQGNIPAAQAACLKLLPMADPLVGATCVAITGSLSGRAESAEQLLAGALTRPTAGGKAVTVWAWTTLAEIRARRGEDDGALAAFHSALALEPDDVYARSALADLLLDQGRNAEARAALGDPQQADALLLRAAIAAQRDGDADADQLRGNLDERFTEAHERGDETHLREQARFALDVKHDDAHALELAVRNFGVQREPADARILLESALAAKQSDAAKPALDWMRTTGIEGVRLSALAKRLADGRSE
ncbi:MAG: tetratricopeptide repeat protein [Dokdonella sp.]|uniref:tetratricopeptide repeat protein n=1 Tax=Dokdonella sp. TaxID=2291710 RepID=UPI003264AD00